MLDEWARSSENVVDHRKARRWLKKFHTSCKKLDEQARSGDGEVDHRTVKRWFKMYYSDFTNFTRIARRSMIREGQVPIQLTTDH